MLLFYLPILYIPTYLSTYLFTATVATAAAIVYFSSNPL